MFPAGVFCMSRKRGSMHNDTTRGGRSTHWRLSESALIQECGRLLVERQHLTRNQMEEASSRARLLNKPLDVVLMEEGLVPEEALLTVWSEITGVPVQPMANFEIKAALVARLPRSTAMQYRIVPVAGRTGGLTLATSRIYDRSVDESLQTLLQAKVDWVLCPRRDIDAAIKHFFGIGADIIEDMEPFARGTGGEGAGTQNLSEAGNPGVVRLVNEILGEAIRMNASDIHLEPMEKRLVLRYRVDGVLLDMPLPEGIARLQRGLVSSLKVMAQLNITERRLPQDGRLRVTVSGEEFDIRVSVLPTQFGEAINLRILNRKTSLLGLQELGFQSHQLTAFQDLMGRSHGIVLITGPTGAGKTSTLYATLSTIKKSDISIVTIEDPVEYQMDGILQIQTNSEIGLDFAAGLRSVLRHDPNVILIGEIRDRETADIAIKSSLTGHLVFSTLHTNDSAHTIARLVDMGIEPFLVASSIQGIVAQRLVRRICPSCREVVTIPEPVREEIRRMVPESVEGAEYYHGRGCPDCRFTGYRGRFGIYEILVVDDRVRPLIVQRAASDVIHRVAVQQGMATLRQNGWRSVLQGITTIEEVMRVTHSERVISIPSLEVAV